MAEDIAKTIRVLEIPLGGGNATPDEMRGVLTRRIGRATELPAPLRKTLLDRHPVPGDAIAFMDGPLIRSMGVVVEVTPLDLRWLQLNVVVEDVGASTPKYDVREMLAAEVRMLLDALRGEESSLFGIALSPQLPTLPEVLPGDVGAQNIILYGPPGTGKTFSTARRALQLLRVVGVGNLDDQTCARYFRQFQVAQRVEFVTFHQSYGYEEFVEGLRPVLKSASGEVQYELHQGVFARIAERARLADEQARLSSPDTAFEFEHLWREVWKRFATPQQRPSEQEMYLVSQGSADNLSLRNVNGPSTPQATVGTLSAARSTLGMLWADRVKLGRAPNNTALQASLKDQRGTSAPATPYWVAWRELWSVADELSSLPPSIVPQFVLVIDEINRGNISKILGELITLIEPDKRLGRPSELRLPLTYSPDRLFGLPSNLHILGTMNTADRSIALLDIALRRRFTFEALMPDPSVIPTVVTDPDLGPLATLLLRQINRRVRFLLDDDHQIGHAFFLPITSYDDLRDVFVLRVIPLLQEYFHGSPDSVGAVLGCPYDARGALARKDPDAGKAPMLAVELLDEKAVLGFDHPDFPDTRLTFAVSPGFRTGAGASLIPYFLNVLVRKDLSAADAALIARIAPPTA